MLSTKQLIVMVQQHKPLWDRHHKNYKDRQSKEKAWMDICTEIDPNFDTMDDSTKQQIISRVAKKWYNVRDSYVKAKKNRQSKPYVHNDLIAFLDPIYDDKDNPIEFISEKSEDLSSIYETRSENYEEEVFVDFTPDEEPAKRIKLSEGKKEESDESIVAVLANLIEKEEDEDRAFFKSITPSVKALSDESKFEFRIQVMTLIKNLKKKEKRKFKVERISENDSE